MQRRSAVPLTARVTPAVAALHTDQVTAEVVPALKAAGIRSILLKGPSIAAWLYETGAPRAYWDVDLLVEEDHFVAAIDVLRERGFRRGQPGWRDLSWSWHRHEDKASVDLHRSLVGVGAEPEVLWRELARQTENLRVGEIQVEVLSRPALAFHIALHAAQHGVDEMVKPRQDLARALARGDKARWSEAAELAERVEATPAFATGLRLDPQGFALADELALPAARPLAVALHATRPPPLVLAVEYLRTSGLRSRLRFVARKLAPRPATLRRSSALARRGPVGLCLAYLWRPFSVLAQVPRGLLAWRRARRAERSKSSV